MLKNYLKTSLRSGLRNKFFSLITLSGLLIGLSSALLIGLYIQQELSFDKFHEKSENIYRIVEKRVKDEAASLIAATTPAAAENLETNYPEVVNSLEIISLWRWTVEYKDKRFYEGDYFYTDDRFIDFFDFPIISGNSSSPLKEPRSIVLTESAAEKYFGNSNPVNKFVTVGDEDNWKITAVIADPPVNSHLRFNMLMSMSTLDEFQSWKEWSEDWNSSSMIVYLELAPDTNIPEFEKKISGLVNSKINSEESRLLKVQNIEDIHLNSGNIEYEANFNKGNPLYIYIFGSIGILILLIASINYVNLATAQASSGYRNISIRKIFGAEKKSLIVQATGESVLFALLAAFLSIALVELLLPYFNALTGKELTLKIFSLETLLFSAAAILVGITAGIYPAFAISRTRIKAVFTKSNTSYGSPLFRRVLVTAQFVLSIGLIASTFTVLKQFNYLNTKDLGFDQNELIIVDINSGVSRNKFELIKNEFRKHPDVSDVSVSSRIPGDWKSIAQTEFISLKNNKKTAASFIGIDEDFLDTYDIALLEGENYTGDVSIDSTAVLLNRKAAKMLGVIPGDYIKIIEYFDGGERTSTDFEARVTGITGDYHITSLHDEIPPMIMAFRSNPYKAIDYFTIKASTGQFSAVVDYIKKTAERLDETVPVEMNFLDARLNDYYEKEQTLSGLVTIAAGLSILLALLGVLGLAAHHTGRRTKEIGIRKVLGASVPDVIKLIFNEFLLIIIIAFIIAAPAVYYFMRNWLSGYAYHIPMGFLPYFAAGISVLILAFITVTIQTLKAAKSNPSKILREE